MNQSDKYVNPNFTFNDILQKADPNNHRSEKYMKIIDFLYIFERF